MAIVVLTSASTSPLTLPGNWNNAGHVAEVMGSGGQAGASQNGTSGRGGGGGGGGAYCKMTQTAGSLPNPLTF